MKYEDYLDLGYEPKDELICIFRVKAKNIRRAAGAIAAESSTGTWSEVGTETELTKKISARVFEIEGNLVKIAYPPELFEGGNMSQIMSSIAGNIFGMKDVKSLRLEDVFFPKKIIRSFKGPKFGITGIRKVLRVKKRPLVGTIVKPKLGLRAKDFAEVAYEAWMGGCDLVKDDENLTSQKFNKFEERLLYVLKMKERAEEETGEKKGYMINVSAETAEMIRRAKIVEDMGNEYIMVDVLTVGVSALQTLRNQEFELIMHAHRAMHAALTRKKDHGISMKVLAKIMRIVGVDQLHIGTGVGKMFETKKDVLQNILALKENIGLKPCMPVASGGLHPLLVPKLLRIFGTDVVIQAGGGIHGHKMGTRAGALAMRRAVEACMEGVSLEEAAKSCRELRIAIQQWGKR